jgi:hypothetical protein
MYRRRYLRAAAAGVTLLAGCGSDDGPSGAAALRSDWADPPVERSEEGLLVVRVLVTNTTSRRQSATLAVSVEIDGGDSYRRRREASLVGDERRVYEVVFEDVPYERYRGSGRIKKELS